jgi:hypothetical protein
MEIIEAAIYMLLITSSILILLGWIQYKSSKQDRYERRKNLEEQQRWMENQGKFYQPPTKKKK